MTTSTVFTNNRTQAVRLPAEMRFSEEIKQVNVRAVGNERIISPITETWNSFFKNEVRASPDFMEVRELQEQAPREAL